MSELKESQTVEASRVKVGLSYKINLGNYETMGIDIGIEDCARPGEKVSEAFERVYGFVQSRLVDKVAEVEKEMKSE